MKKIVFAAVFAFTVIAVNAQGTYSDSNSGAGSEVSSSRHSDDSPAARGRRSRKEEYFLITQTGWGAPGIILGLDFMYRHGSGFALYFNNNIFFPIKKYDGFVYMQEMYFGYSWKAPRFSYTVALGFSGGLYFYDSYSIKKRNRAAAAYGSEGIALAGIRSDFMYFFTSKVGMSFSQTHGFGVHKGRWMLEEKLSRYSFFLKLGIVAKV